MGKLLKLVRYAIFPGWEYKIILTRRMSESVMNKLGEEGWEFAASYEESGIFKRRIMSSMFD